jgi:hypothetical protein
VYRLSVENTEWVTGVVLETGLGRCLCGIYYLWLDEMFVTSTASRVYTLPYMPSCSDQFYVRSQTRKVSLAVLLR